MAVKQKRESRSEIRTTTLSSLPSRYPAGFTLIEILVVTFILAAMIGIVTLRLTRDDRDLVRDEADRFLAVLQAAREEAILRGSVFTAEMRADGYRFLRLDDKGAFASIDEGVLAPRALPPRMGVRIDLDGQPATGTQALVLEPGGTLTAFKVDFSMNAAHWTVLAQNNGKMCSTSKESCDAP